MSNASTIVVKRSGKRSYRLSGVFFFGAAASIGSVLHRIGETRSDVIVDLSAVPFIDSTAAEIVKGAQAKVDSEDQRMAAIGRGYVTFARTHPGLFVLMFRGERLDMSRPALRAAVEASGRVLSGAIGARREEQVETRLTLPQAADIVAAWSLVHGFAMLLLDGRLKTLLARLPPGTDADALLGAIFMRARPKG